MLTQADCLSLWETGRSLHPLDQGVLALRAAFPEVRESIADWPIGRRNRALARVRASLFGAPLRGWVQCNECGEALDFELDGGGLVEGETPGVDAAVTVAGASFRLPTSRDLAAIAAVQDSSEGARKLLGSCCVSGVQQREWSDTEVEAIGATMAAADPLAEVTLHFECPVCSATFDENLDLPAFLWAEMESAARRLLLQVHELATAYGWSETEILSLSSARRDAYLGMVRA